MQDELNERHMGPDFLLSTRYSQLMVTFAVCWMYSPGIPLMPIVGCASFFATYWVDKWLFFCFYRAPPRYNTETNRSASRIVPYTMMIHLCMSIWMLGNKSIFSSDSYGVSVYEEVSNNYDPANVESKITQMHTFPLFMLLLSLIGLNMLKDSYKKMYKVGTRLLRFLFCLKDTSERELLDKFDGTLDVTYSRAVHRGIIKGLAGYNILQNPKYKEAFAITDEFSLTHSHVKSVRLSTANNVSLMGYAMRQDAVCARNNISITYSLSNT
jgi:hypothetical protein